MNQQQEAVYTIMNFLVKLPFWGWLALAAVTIVVLALVLTSLIK